MDRPTWSTLMALLQQQHPGLPLPVRRAPFALVLWEQVAYLVKDEVRALAFAELERRTALDPARIAALPGKDLEAITRRGGAIGWKERAQRIRASAELAHTLDDLADVPLAEARKRLQRFAMIGAPGADRILLTAGLHPVFSVESNGLRVLLRIGFGTEGANYNAGYASALEAFAPLFPADPEALLRMQGLLRAHGTAPCKRSAPSCGMCSVRAHCAFGQAREKVRAKK